MQHCCSQSLVLESTTNKAFPPCDQICFELTRSHDFAGEVCPFEKYCQRGCPCLFYQCEKIDNEQTLVPVWDLKRGKIIKGKLPYLLRKRSPLRIALTTLKVPKETKGKSGEDPDITVITKRMEEDKFNTEVQAFEKVPRNASYLKFPIAFLNLQEKKESNATYLG